MLYATEVVKFPGIPWGQEWENFRCARISSHQMVIVKSIEGLTANFLSERKGKGLMFAASVKFWIKKYFFIKKVESKDVCCFVVFECSRKGAFSDFDAEHVAICNEKQQL